MKGFNELNYPFVLEVEVFWVENGIVVDQITDAIKGLNRGHALYLAKLNWPTADHIEPLDD